MKGVFTMKKFLASLFALMMMLSAALADEPAT